MWQPPSQRRPASPSIELVKQALARKGMSQIAFAKAVDLTKDHVSRVLLNKVSFPSARDTLSRIAQALDLDPMAFREYREALVILPPSTRKLVNCFRLNGMTQEAFSEKVKCYTEGHLMLILRGGTPFPRDPAIIEHLSAAAGCSPFLFEEYLPLEQYRERMARAADLALPAHEAKAFKRSYDALRRGLQALDGVSFEERRLRRFLERTFGTEQLPPDEELDATLAAFPPSTAYEPLAWACLRGLYHKGWSLAELALAIPQADEDELWAIVQGQIRIPAALRSALIDVLEVEEVA